MSGRAGRRAKIRDELVVGISALMILSGVVTFVSAVASSRGNFDELVERNDVSIAGEFALTLAGLYEARGGWDGIGPALLGARDGRGEPDGAEGPRDQAEGGRRRERDDLPLILTDEGGRVVHAWIRPDPEAGADALPTRFDVSGGAPVRVGGRVVGYAFFKSMIRPAYNPQETAFLASMARSTAVSISVALAMGIGLGAAFASRFARRVSALDAAVRSVAEGDLGARVEVGRDDELGSLGANFNAMADRLGANEEARQNLLADLSHELRTPVSVIQANLEMMLAGVYGPDEARLQSLYDETRLLADLIGDLRTLSDVEAGVSRGETRVVDVAGLLEETGDKYRALFEKRGMSLSIDARDGCLALAREDRMRQVVRNVLFNALHYASDGSVVTLSCTRVVRGGAPFARVSVADEGPGVPESELGRIFERFYRVDASRNRDSGGRGLGLAICKQFIEADGGSIVARNTEPRGLEVSFELPAAGPPRTS